MMKRIIIKFVNLISQIRHFFNKPNQSDKGEEKNSVYTEKTDIPKLIYPKIISTWDHTSIANEKAFDILNHHGKIIDAIEQGLNIVESNIRNQINPTENLLFNTCIMNEKSNFAGVALLKDIEHPISVACTMMKLNQNEILLGKKAKKFALKNGFEKLKPQFNPNTKSEHKKLKKQNNKVSQETKNTKIYPTIGILGMDKNGTIYGASTTSESGYRIEGKLDEAVMIGTGLFIDNEIGGAVATGFGEAIIQTAGSHAVVELMRQGLSPDEACKKIIERITEKYQNADIENIQCGFLAINKNGNVGAYSIHTGFNYVYTDKNDHKIIHSDSLFNN